MLFVVVECDAWMHSMWWKLASSYCLIYFPANWSESDLRSPNESLIDEDCLALSLAAKDARADAETHQDSGIHRLAPIFLACLEWFLWRVHPSSFSQTLNRAISWHGVNQQVHREIPIVYSSSPCHSADRRRKLSILPLDSEYSPDWH